jgi:glyoxylase-like metal-dependent hydrolase (beta-lactamase superfamily II)/ACT domain-containing protein
MAMKSKNTIQPSQHVKIYRQIMPADADSPSLLAKFCVSLPDRPGSLAGFATVIARAHGNITFFHYDRAANSNRVAVDVHIQTEEELSSLLAALQEGQYSFSETGAAPDEVSVTSTEGILEIRVLLKNEPGTLDAFARLLAGHDANVIFMLYDEEMDPVSADIALVTQDPAEINRVMQAMNDQGYHYRVIYRGSDASEVANIIGLNMIEKFFLRLKRLLPASDVAELKSLVDSSKDLYRDLVAFSNEAGKNLDAGDVFETVLTFASRSRSMTGANFRAQEMKPLRFLDRVDLMGFRLPTSENIYIFRDGDDLYMIDAGHGIYYNDVKKFLVVHGMDPARVKRIFVTHLDTDHAGTAGYFEREFGTEVFMHRGGVDVISNMNRVHGASGPFLNLNKYYTRLSSRFTECLFPKHPHYFAENHGTKIGLFDIIDSFDIGPIRFDVLQSLGGHTPGLVFFLNRDWGLLFSSDFLLNIASLSAGDKKHLDLYRYLLIDPNSNTRIYREETAALKDMMRTLDRELKTRKGSSLIFPGHGDYYEVSKLLERK